MEYRTPDIFRGQPIQSRYLKSNMSKAMTATPDETWVPNLTLPYKLPHYPLKVRGQFIETFSLLTDKLPDELGRLIMKFLFSTLHDRLVRELNNEFCEVHAFYSMVINEGVTVQTEAFWIPLPYWHILRDKALKKFIDFSVIPWVENNPELPHIHT